MTGGPPARVRPGLLLALVAGRGAWRLAFNLSNVILVATWGRAEFVDYAAATGTSTVLLLLSGGVEKASLRLVPRARAARPYLVGGFALAAALLPLPVLAWLAAAWLLDRPGIGPLQLAVGTFQGLLGLTAVLVGMHRALGRPLRDSQSYLVLSVTILVGALVAGPLDLPPSVFVALLLAAAAGLIAWLWASLPFRLRGLRRRRLLRRCIGGTTVMMGAYDVANGAMISLVYALLGASRFRGQTAQLFIVLSAWTLLSGGFTYLLRVFQPQLVLSLRRRGEGVGRRRARRLTRLVAGGGVAYLVVALGGVALTASGLVSWPRGLPLEWTLVALMLARLPLYLLTGMSTYMLENSGARSLKLAAVAAGGALLLGALLALALIPPLGAPGAVLVLMGYDALQACMLLGGLRRVPSPAVAT